MRKIALIIGNTEYQDPKLVKLASPKADVDQLAAVLKDPDVGAFDEVQELVDESQGVVSRAIGRFFLQRRADDLLLLYFSGHGIRDDHGRLYLAVKDTEYELLQQTAVPAHFVTEQMDRCLSRRQVLVLDCCHSGAVASGVAKGVIGESVGTAQAFKGSGYGRVILTASDSTQYAWEGDRVMGAAPSSVFTHHLIEGLRSGAADLDQDGWVGLDELYDYVYERVTSSAAKQTPGKWSFNQQGGVVIARNNGPVFVKFPKELQELIESPFAPARELGVRQLEAWLESEHRGKRASALQALERLCEDDSRKLSTLAKELLAKHAAAVPAAVASAPPRASAVSPPTPPPAPPPPTAPPPAPPASPLPQVLVSDAEPAPAAQAVGNDWASKGVAALATGHLTTAAEAFRVALSQGGADVAASVYTAVERHADMAVALGRGSHAEACLGLLVELFPERAEARARAGQLLTQQGQAFEASGQLGAAARVYARLVALLPGSEQARGLLEAVQKKLEEQASIDEVFDAALLAHEAGRLREASDAWKRLIQRDVLVHRGVSVAAKLADALEGRGGSSENASARPGAKPAAPAPPPGDSAPTPASGPAPTSDAPAMIDSSVLWRDDRIKRESNTTAKLAVLFTVVVCVVLTVAVVMSRPRLIGMSLSSSTTEVKVGQKLELHPAAVYDPDRRAGPDLSRWCYSCDWSSSDRSVATVSYGTVAGVAAGTATITVGYEGKTDELEVTVLPWDFPGLKGNLEAVKFFAVAPSLDVPEQTARAYQATFSAGSQASIWLELTVNIGDKAPPRNLFAGISAELGGPGRDPIERFITFTAQEDWPGVVTVHQLFDKVPAPGTYALTLQHAGRDIGSAKFTVQ